MKCLLLQYQSFSPQLLRNIRCPQSEATIAPPPDKLMNTFDNVLMCMCACNLITLLNSCGVSHLLPLRRTGR